MKKIVLVCLESDRKNSLEKLRDLGVLHVKQSKDFQSEKHDKIENNIEKIQHALNVLSEFSDDETKITDEDFKDLSPLEVAKAANQTHININWLKENISNHNRIYQTLEPWGEFDGKILNAIREKGIDIRFCACNEEEIPKLPKETYIKEISKKGKIVYFVVISREPLTIELPEVSIHTDDSMKDIIERNHLSEEGIAKNKGRLKILAQYFAQLKDYLAKLQEKLEFQINIDGLGNKKSLNYIQGYIPKKHQNMLLDSAEKNGWAIKFETPSEDDTDVPTSISVPKWLNISKPLFDFVGITPGYKEFDISAWFLIFFSIFFAILVGDAGYGAIFLTFTVIAKTKMPKSVQTALNLILILSISTILWGILTANYFGTSPDFLPGGLKYLTDPKTGQAHIQSLCLLIGAIHLSIAHIWRFTIAVNNPVCLSQAGWTAVIWGNYMLASSLITGTTMSPLAKYLYIAGAILILLFSNPSKNIFKLLGGGVAHLLGNAINSFVDVVSYIRLFAVGLAGFYVAKSFNEMGMGLTQDAEGFMIIVKFALATFIIIFGHLLNIALCGLSVLVHGIRLNTLEFSGHMGLEWTGILFSPFQKKTKP
ncbi:MAG: hypothetical protein U9O87_10840 [Verrucomicrobiota bacterium]|nr:hypothetical protein [Verrucomicrobiota bacterium]